MTKIKSNKKTEKCQNKYGTRSKRCFIVTSVIFALTAFLSYKLYLALIYIPEKPVLDLEEWWGPNNTRQTQDTSIRPFRIVFSDAMETDLRTRFEEYRRLDRPSTFEGAGWTYGVNTRAFENFFNYWIFKYKFRERERFLNKYNHFKTNIQGLDIHYLHVKPTVDRNVKVLPLLLLHGWPGSFREFYEVIPLLTTKRPGYDFVFEVIVPSLPGYGYSDAPVRKGLCTVKSGVVLRNLMRRLGFEKYYVQGGDMGHLVGSSMAKIFPEEVAGFHTNMAVTMTKASLLVWILGGIFPVFQGLIENNYADRLYPIKDKVEFFLEEFGYLHMHMTKPDTWGIALTESPVGLAGYMLDKFVVGTNLEGKFREDGGLDVFSKDALLDNIMTYWMTNCITTSMRLYTENYRNSDLKKAVSMLSSPVPTWALRLKHEIFFEPEFVLKWRYPNLLGTTTLDEGGHFAALEKPVIFADDLFHAISNFQKFQRM